MLYRTLVGTTRENEYRDLMEDVCRSGGEEEATFN
jgi:hypothetical protein